MNPVGIIHLGAENCVTVSCHLVRFRPKTDADINILVDCGTAYGHDPEPGFDQFPVLSEKIDFLFLTHAHIHHIGRVPDLIAAGFRSWKACWIRPLRTTALFISRPLPWAEPRS